MSIGEPKPAEGFDIGRGIIARVHPETKELVGLTIIGLSKKILREIKILSEILKEREMQE
ncbi:hypothetical protein DRN97_10655 [Methanosarcinales archaeon]|nr:MAG: hypothetical protein DRN97_10655 [Methanosarcinales archaeon]